MTQCLSSWDSVQLRVIGSLLAANELTLLQAKDRIQNRCHEPEKVLDRLCDEVIDASNRHMTIFLDHKENNHAVA